jgi:hypothetical protein
VIDVALLSVAEAIGPRWRATQNFRKTSIRRILSPVWLGSLQNFVVGIAYYKLPAARQ